MVVLALLSLVAGFVQTPEMLGGVHLFSGFLQHGLPATALDVSRQAHEGMGEAVSAAVALIGVALAYLLVRRAPAFTAALVRRPAFARLHRFWFSGWRFDWLYDRLLVRPYVFLARIDRDDVIDAGITALARAAGRLHRTLAGTQTGSVRTYATGLAVGAAVVMIVAVWL
jgi:NADH-quinone oxidoreductase subunit L